MSTWLPRTTSSYHVERVPWVIVIAVFISTIGHPMALPGLWQLQLVACPLAMIGFLMFSPAEHSALKYLRFSPTLAAVLAWVVLSAGWSPLEPKAAVRYAGGILIPVTVAHLAATIYDSRRLLRGLVIASTVLMVVVALDALLRPGIAFSSGAADGTLTNLGLRSIFYQKNSLGAVLVLIFALRYCIDRRALRVSFTALLVVLLVLCKSSTSVLAVLGAASAQWIASQVAWERRNGRRGSVVLAAGGVFIGLVTVAAVKDRVFTFFGKDSRLSGRDEIWEFSWEAAKRHLWRGYGMDGFWNRVGGPADDIRHRVGFPVGSAHQGVIEVVLEYGIVGVVLIALLLFALVALVSRPLLAGRDTPVVLACVGLIVGPVVSTLTEGGLYSPVLMIFALVSGILMSLPDDELSDHEVTSAAVG